MGNQMQKSISDTRNQKQTSFTFEIDNFSEKKAAISSSLFGCGGCKWYVTVYPKGYYCRDHLAVILNVASPKSLRTGWKRKVSPCFVLLNQSGKELQILSTSDSLYSTQVLLVSKIFARHPDIAVDFKPKSQVVKTAYMNVLLGLIETLRKPPQSFSETELSNAHSKLRELTEAGFKLDWLKEKLGEVALKRKNAIADGSRVEEVEERINNLKVTLLDLIVELKKEKAKSAAAAKVLSFDDIV
ncbi:MATH/TRAF domain [Arabidopsis suecica]|uniref:MATH/TRAF domain n=1 Tax=Arabidopsis suecica TaxID=45249 RepID=A0A8T2APS1_ARASU|nr:MATH/TRAF domain [Arabidopsis suecica]